MRIKARSIDLRVNVGPTQKEREERIIKERERRREAGHINRMKKLQEEIKEMEDDLNKPDTKPPVQPDPVPVVPE